MKTIAEIGEVKFLQALPLAAKRYLAESLFKAVFSTGDLQDKIFRLKFKSNPVEYLKFVPIRHTLRGYQLTNLLTGHKADFVFVEQNPKKNTWCAKLAEQGLRCGWFISQGNFLSFLFEHKNHIYIIGGANKDKQVAKVLSS